MLRLKKNICLCVFTYMKTTFLFNDLIDFLAPKVCLVSGEKIDSSSKFKYFNQKALDRIPLAPGSQETRLRLRDKLNGELFIDEFICLYDIPENSEYMNLIYKLKYSGIKNIGIELGVLLGRKMIIEGYDQNAVLIPVPLHKSKQRERTFNQSEIICKGISSITGNKIITDSIKRTKYTITQTKLGAVKRERNVDGAFQLSKSFDHLSVIIIDDVITTGSTVNSIAKIIKERYACKISAASIGLA